MSDISSSKPKISTESTTLVEVIEVHEAYQIRIHIVPVLVYTGAGEGSAIEGLTDLISACL